MSTRANFPAARFWMTGLAFLLTSTADQAAPIRVTTWDLLPAAVAGTNGEASPVQQSPVLAAAASLKKIRPDIILLQQVADWATCHQLAQALQPETYQVAICSSFRDANAKLLGRQVAILSTAKAYLAWSEPWQQSNEHSAAPGGFAFAALRLGNKNVGVFSVQLSDGVLSSAEENWSVAWQQAREESARQLVKEMASLQDWKNNRVQTFIVAGDFNTIPEDARLAHEKTLLVLEQFGLDNAFAGMPLEQRVTRRGNARRPAATLDYIFTANAGLVGPALVTPNTFYEHAAVTCEMDFALPKAIPPTPPLAARTESPPLAPPVNAATSPAVTSPAALSPAATSPAVTSPVVTSPAATSPAVASPAVASPAATTPGVSPQIPWWVAGVLVGGLTLYFAARKFLRRTYVASVPRALPGLNARIGGSISRPHADQIIIAPPPERPPYVHIETDGSMQTQSQTWHPRAEAARLAPRMTEAVREGVIANLSRWLKQKAVQRLVSDRERLLATQQAAGLKVLAVDQRLARIEHQIQQINHEYERRIDDLLKELIAAKEENRELIRAKIALVKAEMEKARLRAGQHAREYK